MQALPYWRLSGFYFFYFAVLGALMPYWNLYLDRLGFSARDIGLLSAIVFATKIVAPNLWGWLADRSGARVRIIRLGAFLAAFCFLGVFLRQDFLWFALVIAAYSFFWNAVLPQYEVLTLNSLGEQPQRYSLVRLWGSVGFIVAVVGLGVLLDAVGVLWLPHALLGLLLGIWLCSLTVQAAPLPMPRSVAQDGAFVSLLRQPMLLAFFAAAFLMQMSHGPYYTFFTIYLENRGFSSSLTGLLWALGVLAEVLIFLVMHRLLPRFGVRRIFIASLVLATLRWLMIGLGADYLPVLLLAQCLHAASFGSFHAVAIELVRRCFSPAHQGRAQALYSAINFGAGGAVGAVMSGWVWDIGPAWSFACAAAASGLGAVLAWHFLHDPKLGRQAAC